LGIGADLETVVKGKTIMNRRKKIVILGPTELYPGCDINPTTDAEEFFKQDDVDVRCSMNREDVEKADGLVIPGGLPDVNPAYWSEKNLACHVIDVRMDEKQMALIDLAVKLKKPIFGICRGYQLVCVYFGGTLEQDIASNNFHRYESGNPRFHDIYNVPGTLLHDVYGDILHTNSAHHQALKKIPDCLQVAQLWCANEKDTEKYLQLAREGKLKEGNDECVIEAVIHKSYPYLGLQWHPESQRELYCKDIDLKKIRDIFYQMME